MIKTNTLIAILTAVLMSIATCASATIAVDSVHTTGSRCANDGSIRVYAHSNTSMLYATVSGPDIRISQSGSQFSALPSGTYRVMITNFSNDTAFVSAIVPGNYTAPDFAPTHSNPTCPGTATGIIVGNADSVSLLPYSWVLTNLSTNATITHTGDTFRNLPAGNYSLRLYDSCQGYATRYITLTDPPSTGFRVYIENHIMGCDTDLMNIYITPTDPGGWAQPYTVYITTMTGSYTYTLNLSNLPLTTPSAGYSIVVPGISQGQTANMTVVNNCGVSVFVYNHIGPLIPNIYFPQHLDSCSITYTPSFYLQGNDSAGNANYLYETTTSVRVWDSTSNTLFDSTTIEGILSHILIPGHLYSARLTDQCGLDVSISFTSPALDTVYMWVRKIPYSCLDSTASILISGYNFTSTPLFSIISGPPIVSSTKPYFNHWDTITYPQIYNNPGCSSYTPPTTCYQVGGLGIGTYTFKMYDTCGHSITDSIVIQDVDLTDFKYQKHIIKGCPGQNQIGFDLTITNGWTYPGLMRIKEVHMRRYSDSLIALSDTFNNLNAGTYVLDLVQSDFGYNIIHKLLLPGMSCTEFHDTIIIPPYQTPRVDYAVQIKCNGTVNVGMQPDSSRGVPPYKYEIISGPQNAPVQASNFFTLTQPGQYTARISDTCGFAGTFSFSVDTLILLRVTKSGSSCLGNSGVLIADHSAYYTYIWQRPNGTYYTGDTLPVGPVSAADYGLYHIIRIVNINNCRDTARGTYLLNSSSVTYTSASICPGQSYMFGGRPRTLAGTYSDTIHTAVCDSISFLSLAISGPVYTYSTEILCAPQSVTVGSHTYRSTGIYIDTLSRASGCDSIHTLDLTVYPIYRDSFSFAICSGWSITVGPHTYTTSGIYHDTLQSVWGCDSFTTVNLRVDNSSQFGIYSFSLCDGDSLRFGDTVFHTAGGFVKYTPTGSPCGDSVTLIIIRIGQYRTTYTYLYKCPGHSLTYNGRTYDTTGIFFPDTLHTSTCDSIPAIYIQNRPYTIDSVSLSICAGRSLTVGTHVYTVPGIYRDTFSTPGCDSICILNLSVGGLRRDSVSQRICTGQSVTVGSHSYSSSGIYRDTFSTVACDSVHILKLTVGSVILDSVSRSICSGQSVMVGSHSYSTSGIYRDTFATAGCDSVHVLKLTVDNVIRDSVSLSICAGQSVAVGSHTYSTSGIYRDTFATAGCDSVHILNLSAGNIIRDSVSQSICNGRSVTVGLHTYSVSGIYRDTFATAGCDSVHILKLTVDDVIRDSVSQSICPGQSVMVGSHSYITAGIYRDTFATTYCDSIHILNLSVGVQKRDTLDIMFCEGQSITINGTVYSHSGMYADTFSTIGCDSILTIRAIAQPLPHIEIVAGDSTVIAGDTVQLSATGSSNVSYNWTSSLSLNDAHIATPVATASESGWVICQVKDSNYCIAEDSFFITVSECEGRVYIPNAFTPNGDGKNELYQIFGRCIKLNYMEIYNRWGEKVWETHDINEGWDGKYMGEAQPSEVYVYVINYMPISSKGGTGRIATGSITLIR